MKRRATLLASLALAFAASTALGQDFPSRTVNIVVPFPAGGTADVFARTLAPSLSKTWGQSVIVLNRPGAGGNIAAEFVARAAPDGHTLFLVPDPVLSTNHLIYPKLPFDAKRDFTPITRAVEFPSAIFVSSALGVKTLAELQALAKASPGKLSYASFGVGSAPHIGMEMFKSVAGVDIVHIPYKGLADVLPAMATGDTQVLFVGHGISQTGPVQEGRLRALAVAGNQRSSLMPDVQTFAEAGFPTLKGPNYWGIVAPSRVPRPIVDRIRRDVAQALTDPAFVDRFVNKNGYELVGDTPEQFAARIQELTDIWAPVIKSANIRLE